MTRKLALTIVPRTSLPDVLNGLPDSRTTHVLETTDGKPLYLMVLQADVSWDQMDAWRATLLDLRSKGLNIEAIVAPPGMEVQIFEVP